MNNLLEIIGPYPPPLGGISVHISRMEYFLKKEKINYRILNHGYFNSTHVVATNKSVFWYVKYLFSNEGSLIHFHQFFKFHFLYYYIFSRLNKKKIVITVHSERMIHTSVLERKIIFWLLRNTRNAFIISVSKNLSDLLLKAHNVENRLLPAVVPSLEITPVKLATIPGKEYFLYSIWKLDRKTAVSIYNIELAMELLSKVKDRFHMLFLIGSETESDKEYLTFLIEKYALVDAMTVIYEGNLVEYLNNCKFFLRTNTVDGYGVSIQEALNLKIPAIASDACVRPKGAILFKTGSFEDLYEKVMNVDRFWNESEVEITNYHVQLIELYKKLMSK